MDNQIYFSDIHQALGAAQMLVHQGQDRCEIDLNFLVNMLELLIQNEEYLCEEH